MRRKKEKITATGLATNIRREKNLDDQQEAEKRQVRRLREGGKRYLRIK